MGEAGIPAGTVVALAAVMGEAGGLVPGVGGPVIIAAVAGVTVGGRTIVLSARMTIITVDGTVAAV